jgi:hypothetical protein
MITARQNRDGERVMVVALSIERWNRDAIGCRGAGVSARIAGQGYLQSTCRPAGARGDIKMEAIRPKIKQLSHQNSSGPRGASRGVDAIRRRRAGV